MNFSIVITCLVLLIILILSLLLIVVLGRSVWQIGAMLLGLLSPGGLP